MTGKTLKLTLIILTGIIISQNSISQSKDDQKYDGPESSPLFSRLHTLSIHVRDTVTQDSVFHFLVNKLKLPIYYSPIKYGNRKYAGVYAGNLVLEPCGPYSNFSYGSIDFRAIFFGLTFEPFKSISLSSKGLSDRKIPHEIGDSYIYVKDSTLCNENITISFMDKGLGKIEDKRTMDSLSLAITHDIENELGIEYVMEIGIGYKDNNNLQKWEKFIRPGKLRNGKLKGKSNKIIIHFRKSLIREVQGITFKVTSLERAKQYLIKNKLFGNDIDNRIKLDTAQTFGLHIFFTDQDN